MKDDPKDLDQLLKETFTNEFRSGYVNAKGVTMTDLYPNIADSIENLKIWDDDVWVCSFPKSGTTWTQEMVWCISHNLDFKGAEVNLTTRFPFLESSARVDNAALIEKFPELANHEFVHDSVKFVEDLPRPRFIKTHLPFQLLPRDLREGRTQAKIVYVCRNPKDVCISFYHHTKHFAFRGDFEQFCRLFLGDKVPYCPFWNHIFGFWNKRNDSSYNILFLKYEDMKSDLISVIQKTAKFLKNAKLFSEELNQLLDHLSFENMKKNPAVNHKSMFEFTKQYLGASGEAEFIRRGQVNQWKTVMSPNILAQFDEWISKNLKTSDFSFESPVKPNIQYIEQFHNSR
ncbi:sulfotransferase 4A1 [Diachasma alloeum]|uniref:sulfotransferase 4A1 n=1 Tax=Diachasma alloeum TaxID=454923 RepID=UPI0010FBBB6D|nr:sulfotransferase 4A1 [Diachasma alloeum]